MSLETSLLDVLVCFRTRHNCFAPCPGTIAALSTIPRWLTFTLVMFFRALAHICTTQSKTVDGDMHPVGLQTANAQEEEASCATFAPVQRVSTPVWSTSVRNAILFVAMHVWPALQLQHLAPSAAMVWFKGDGRSDTTAVHCLFGRIGLGHSSCVPGRGYFHISFIP